MTISSAYATDVSKKQKYDSLVGQADEWLFGNGKFNKIVKGRSETVRVITYFPDKGFNRHLGAVFHHFSMWANRLNLLIGGGKRRNFFVGFNAREAKTAFQPVPRFSHYPLAPRSHLYVYGVDFVKFRKILDRFSNGKFVKEYREYSFVETGGKECYFRRYSFFESTPYISWFPWLKKRERFFITIAFAKYDPPSSDARKKKTLACVIGAFLFHRGVSGAHYIATKKENDVIWTIKTSPPKPPLYLTKTVNLFPLWLLSRPEIYEGMPRKKALLAARKLAPLWLKILK